MLTCSASWVHHPVHLDLMYTARNFLISVDPTGLPAGPHSAYINAFDSSCPEKGKLFEIPIHVMRSEELTKGLKPSVTHKVFPFLSILRFKLQGGHYVLICTDFQKSAKKMYGFYGFFVCVRKCTDFK